MSEVPIQVLAFDDMMRCNVEDFLALSTELGEPMIEFAFMVKDAFDKSRMLIEFCLYNSAPENENEFFLSQPLTKALEVIQKFRDANPKNSAFYNHLSMISESIVALNWPIIKRTPTQFIKDMKESGQFYANRVLVSHKGNAKHTNWVNKWAQIMDEVELYVKHYFLTGFTWGAAQGGMLQPRLPPPPPPPPAPEFIKDFEAGDGGSDARQALINELNQGTGITSRLKPVNKTGSTGTKLEPGKKSVGAVKPQAKVYPPKFVLEGRKWVIEHQKDNPSLTLDNQMSESVAMYSCQSSFLEILNKINNIVIDSSKKVSIIIRGDVISCVEIIRCEGLKIQCEGVVPLINCANSDNIQIFVNEQSKHVQLIASKSSSLNMCMMQPDGDYVEYPVPEQIMSVIENGKLKSSVVDNI
ncbi:adenylyl cyclase-associated protein 2 [Parasteatoda tepidariorum]|uniref:Adenylyl cyclase-associated protein n=1 Tax=Parasteatoda tepidariorum TaxID=114398 RepID=A0A2L2XX09_PARTP|nr:adenylyl cyclase-associated protein 2 [Parasteatoda tepidariorum]XP_015912677.1 adenylyl cyclase-associated protein 2 [Parasteatoda tepidariorum]